MTKRLLFLLALLVAAIPAAAMEFPFQASSTGGASVVDSSATLQADIDQAFVLNDGNADLTDWAGSNDLSLPGGAADPTWAGSNDGLVFDGTDDYATFTPTVANWQPGYAVAILSTLPNTVNQVLFNSDNSGATDQRVRASSNEFTAFNRAQVYFGRNFSNNEGYADACGTGNSTKVWRFFEYDSTADDVYIYENNAGTSCDSDTAVTEFETPAMNRARLGSATGGTNFLNGTIYRVYVFPRSLTTAERQAIIDGWTPAHN